MIDHGTIEYFRDLAVGWANVRRLRGVLEQSAPPARDRIQEMMSGMTHHPITKSILEAWKVYPGEDGWFVNSAGTHILSTDLPPT